MLNHVQLISSFLTNVVEKLFNECTLCVDVSLGWSLKLKLGKSKLQTLKIVGIVEKTLLVNFFLNQTTFTPPSSTLKFHAEDPKRRFLSAFKWSM